MIGRIMGWMRGHIIPLLSLPATAEGLEESLASRRRLAAAEWARDLIISNVKLTQIADDPAAKRKPCGGVIVEDLAKRERLAAGAPCRCI